MILVSAAYAEKSDAVTQYDREIRQQSGKLDSIKTELEKGRSKLQELQKEEGNFLGKIEQIEKNISASRTYLELLAARIDTVEQVISGLQDSLVLAQKDLVSRQEVMKKRLRKAYMSGTPHPFLMILSAKNPVDFINKTRYLEDLNRYDRKLLNEIDQTRKVIDKTKSSRQEERQRLAMLLQVKKEEQAELLKEESQRKVMLEDVRSKKNAYQAMISELEASQKELNAMIRLLEDKRKKAKQDARKGVMAFEKRKGKLPWPVEGPVVGRYGKVVHPVYKTVIMNNGIDIGAQKGQPVQCIAPGTVIHVGSMRGLGRMVIVDHAGGYLTIYAHLDEIQVNQDQQVEFGSILGSVGDSGSLGGVKLHFELRKSTETLDPVEWLEK